MNKDDFIFDFPPSDDIPINYRLFVEFKSGKKRIYNFISRRSLLEALRTIVFSDNYYTITLFVEKYCPF